MFRLNLLFFNSLDLIFHKDESADEAVLRYLGGSMFWREKIWNSVAGKKAVVKFHKFKKTERRGSYNFDSVSQRDKYDLDMFVSIFPRGGTESKFPNILPLWREF